VKRVTVAVVAGAALAAADGLYFSPAGGCEQALLDAIAGAEKSIAVAMYCFTNERLADALIAAAGRGVRVRVLLDEEQLTSKYIQGPRLAAAPGVEVKIEKRPGSLHIKYAVIDDETFAAGSYNWTYPAEKENDEFLIVEKGGPYARAFATHFAKLWEATPRLGPPPAAAGAAAPVVAGVRPGTYHLLGCPFLTFSEKGSCILYRTAADAAADGNVPCAYCRPSAYAGR